jgi:hypothetical protein
MFNNGFTGSIKRKCTACRASAVDVTLYEPFDGIYYCKECMEKYRLPIPEITDKILDDWNIH